MKAIVSKSKLTPILLKLYIYISKRVLAKDPSGPVFTTSRGEWVALITYIACCLSKLRRPQLISRVRAETAVPALTYSSYLFTSSHWLDPSEHGTTHLFGKQARTLVSCYSRGVHARYSYGGSKDAGTMRAPWEHLCSHQRLVTENSGTI